MFGIEILGGKYSINEKGGITSFMGRKSRELHPRISGRGYQYVQLKGLGLIYIHKLVAMTFLPNPNNYSIVNHINGNKLDNRMENLQWCSKSADNLHAIRMGLRKTIKRKLSKGQQARLYLDRTLRRLTYRELAEKYNIAIETAHRLIKGGEVICWG